MFGILKRRGRSSKPHRGVTARQLQVATRRLKVANRQQKVAERRFERLYDIYHNV